MKISIIGLPGSGKSTLARRIHERLGIPHIHIDRFWLEAGGENTARGDNPHRNRVRAYVLEKVEEAIVQDEWVSDGFYSRLQPEIAERADILVHLDISLPERLKNHLTRTFKNPNRHPELSFWDDIKFIPDLVRRSLRTGPKIRKFVAEHPSKLVTLRSRSETQTFLDSLPSK